MASAEARGRARARVTSTSARGPAVAIAVAVTVGLVVAGCSPAHAPAARRVGQVLAVGGVIGLIGTVAASPYVDGADELLTAFSVISGGGVVTFAIGELSGPRGAPAETQTQKYRRWARILTERALGAAREGQCVRVRKLERRVHFYDPEVHDFVFMRDAAIGRCLGVQGIEPAATAEPDARSLPEAAPEPSAPEPVAPAPVE